MGDSKSASTGVARTGSSEGEEATAKSPSQKGDGASESATEKRDGTRDRIRAFGSKGAAAKSVPEPPRSAMEEERRKTNISALQSVIQPKDDKIKETPASESPRVVTEEPPLPVKKQQPKRKSEVLREEIFKEEEGDQTLANLVLNLVQTKRAEKQEEEQIALSESAIFKRSRNMSPLEQAGIVSVLEETIAKLDTLGFTHGKPVVKQEIKYISILDKLAVKEESELIGLIKSNKSDEEYENLKHFIKLQKDRGFLEEALYLTLLEMKQNHTFKILQDIVHLEEEMKVEEADLRFIAKNRQQEVNHCKALLESEYRRGKKKLDDRTALLAMLKDEIQDMQYYNGLKYKYIDHWERSRTEQNEMMLQHNESGLDKKLSDYEEMSNIEKRCTAEIRAFIEESISNLAATVEDWMRKYETEMEDRENKINKLKEEREEHFKKLQARIDLVNLRQKQMDDWKAYKERQRQAAEYQVYLVKMATRIQAWWRGTMVRNHLGPYRKKKGKRGKKK